MPEARELGAQIYVLKPPRQSPLSYGRRFARLLRGNGPFDVVHSHVHLFSGLVLRVAAQCRIPYRIAHSHTNDDISYAKGRPWRCAYRHIMRRSLHRYATAGLACSPSAAASLYGRDWQADSRWRVLPYGLDLSRFGRLPSRQHLRAELRLPPQRRIIGQVGRLSPEKNHHISIRILESLVQNGIDAHWLVVGGGALEGRIRELLKNSNLESRATLVGDQADVAPFVGAMDCLLFPSEWEGFGIVALEAQAAGVPVVASDRVPEQVVVIPGMVERIPLERGPAAFAESVITQLAVSPRPRAETCELLTQSQFGIANCVEQLCAIYRLGRDFRRHSASP